MTTPPRARFAPSPTGYFHVGSARAALFNWLFVRQHGGTFVLRIEDTDEARNRPEWTDGIITALDWLGMAPDEGPYFQTAQADVHATAIEALWATGALYAYQLYPVQNAEDIHLHHHAMAELGVRIPDPHTLRVHRRALRLRLHPGGD